MSWFCWQQGVLQLELHIHPGTKHAAIVGLHGQRLRLKLHAPAVDGCANGELIEFLARCFRTAKSNVAIVRGQLGRNKSVRISPVGEIPAALSVLGLTSPNPT